MAHYNQPTGLATEEKMGRIRNLHCLKSNEVRRLVDFGVASTDRLLLIAAGRQGRQDLAQETGLSEEKILEAAQLADLMRVKGIGCEYTRLLDRVGIHSLKQLGRRSPERLLEDFEAINDNGQVVRRLPSLDNVASWIAGAKRLQPLVSS